MIREIRNGIFIAAFLWLAFGLLACEESTTNVDVILPDTTVLILPPGALACTTVVRDTVWIRHCPAGYYWDDHKWRCRKDWDDRHWKNTERT